MCSLLRTITLIGIFSVATPAITKICAQTLIIQPGWKVLQLPHGWLVDIPKDFTTKKYQGVDSEPGVIRSKKRGITLEYDIFASGFRSVRKPDCDTTRAVISDVGINYFDDGRRRLIAIVTVECRNGVSIGLSGTNLREEGERLATEIFKTLRISYNVSSRR